MSEKKEWNLVISDNRLAIRMELGDIFSFFFFDLEDIMLCEISQTEKEKYCMISLMNK